MSNHKVKGKTILFIMPSLEVKLNRPVFTAGAWVRNSDRLICHHPKEQPLHGWLKEGNTWKMVSGS